MRATAKAAAGCAPGGDPIVAPIYRLEDREHVAGGILEPGDRRALVAHDSTLVLVESLVALEGDARGRQLVDGGIHVGDRKFSTVNEAGS